MNFSTRIIKNFKGFSDSMILQIESSIWEQIDNGNENDYIHFHLRKADGTYFSVLDHGRIVESPQYGKVFYVLFMDLEDMHIRYNDKFAR